VTPKNGMPRPLRDFFYSLVRPTFHTMPASTALILKLDWREIVVHASVAIILGSVVIPAMLIDPFPGH